MKKKADEVCAEYRTNVGPCRDGREVKGGGFGGKVDPLGYSAEDEFEERDAANIERERLAIDCC